MKTYTLAQLKKIVREQGYKMAALRSPDGERIVPFNKYVKNAQDLDKQFDVFEKRVFKTDLHPDGVYYVLLAHNINSSRKPFEFPVTKGTVSKDELKEAEKKSMPLTVATVVPPVERALSFEGAIEMNREIAMLSAKVQQLEFEKKQLLDQIAEYEADQEESLEEQEEKQESPLFKLLEQLAPIATATLEKHYSLEERKLNLEEMKLQKHNVSNAKPPVKKMVAIGSQEHLNLIESLYNDANQDERFNEEMDRLERVNPELYAWVCNNLQIEFEEDENSQSEEGGNDE